MNVMGRRLLIGGYEIPGYSGTTAAYQLFEKMLKSKLDVHYVNIIDEQDVDFFIYEFGENCGNPKGLPNVYWCVQDANLEHPSSELPALLGELTPDLSIGVGHIAALLLKRASPHGKLIFLTHGCRQMIEAIASGNIKDFLTLEKFIQSGKRVRVNPDDRERQAVELADLIITHSDSTKFLYRHFFPKQAAKIASEVIWFAEWIYQEALGYSRFRKSFSERDIDVLFVSGSWTRPEKNYRLVRKLLSSLNDARVHIVGETEQTFDDASYHGLAVTREDLFSLLGRAKTLVMPSLFDAAPGILFEAAAMDCNLVASRNCGNWRICNENLMVDPFTKEQFLKKTSLSLSNKFADNVRVFLDTNSYQNLLATLSKF